MNPPQQLQLPRVQRVTDQRELEWRLIYSIIVAGKSAKFADAAMVRWYDACLQILGDAGTRATPFELVPLLAKVGKLDQSLREARTGNYTKIAKALFFIDALKSRFNTLAILGPQELETIPGVGPKTSRFFILWTRPDARHAALDTHVLKWLDYLRKNQRETYDSTGPIPASTPSRKQYAELEALFLKEADTRGMKPRELDAAIWDWCREGKHKGGQWPEALRARNGVSR